MKMKTTICQRISVAGNDCWVETAAMKKLFKKLGGHATIVTDKSVTIEFPSESAAREFQTFAESCGAMFD